MLCESHASCWYTLASSRAFTGPGLRGFGYARKREASSSDSSPRSRSVEADEAGDDAAAAGSDSAALEELNALTRRT